MDSPPPLFTARQEIGTSLVSYGILSKAWGFLPRNIESFILKENDGSFILKEDDGSFILKKDDASFLLKEHDGLFILKEHDGIAYVAFASFHNIDDFIVKESEYGEGNIQTDNTVFSDCLKGKDDKPSLVHQGALKLFLHIMKNTDFEAKLQIYTDEKEKKLKPIIFVGHFLGGAVATLATLWVLQKRLSKSSPFCITFACPLVGDAGLVEAVRRENWGGNFCHVVSKNDIAPRMLLAPIQSIVKPLTAVFLYWQGILPYSFVQEDCRTLLENVMKYTCPAPNQGLEISPYRPVGTYMLCSSHGAAYIENSETVLQLLHWTMQSQEKPSDDIVMACILEHTDYGSVPGHVTQNSTRARKIGNCSSDSYTMGISLQIQAIDVEAQNDHAQLALRKAGETEKMYNTNDKLAIELSLKQSSMAELEWYKERCEKIQTSFDEIVQACLSEHIRYDSVLEEVLQNSTRGIRSIENSNSESPYEMGILLQLEAIGVGAQNDHAQLALRKAGETENRYNTNVDKLAIELSLKQSSMVELEWYKERCEKDHVVGYYDTFKDQNMKDIHADTHRMKLAGFWDEIIQKWEGHELPSDFESQNKWINAGNTYRKLVEPLDIAYYYRNNSNGNYVSDGRHNRHKVLQKWMEAKEKARSSRGRRPRTKFASLTEDSCFWANVEEARKDLENLKQGQHQSPEGLEEFEDNVTRMFNYGSISSDVFFEGSSFMMWWEEWKEYNEIQWEEWKKYNKNLSPDWSSPLSKIMETLSWKR